MVQPRPTDHRDGSTTTIHAKRTARLYRRGFTPVSLGYFTEEPHMEPVDVEQAQQDVDGYFGDGIDPEDIIKGLYDLQDGTYHNLPLADYLRVPMWSQSSLKEAGKSAAHAKAAREGHTRTPPSDAMILGSALHLAFLEPE